MANRLNPALTVPVLLTLGLAACNGGDDFGSDIQNNNLLSEDQENITPDSHQDASVSFSTIADGIWPPQPVDVDNVQLYESNSLNESDRLTKFALSDSSAVALAIQNPEIMAMLEGRYEVIGHHVKETKNVQGSIIELEIFNYSTNQVVQVSIDADQRMTTSYQNAREYQPAETENEVQLAIALAADQLQLLGHQTDKLIGTGLLAHPTTEEYNRNGHAFYDHRIIYVTFGRGEGTTPLFRANVNLSTETVDKAGPL